MPFDPTKPVQTESGLPARIICTDRKRAGNEYKPASIIALITMEDGSEISTTHLIDGQHVYSKDWNLVNIPVRLRTYVPVVNTYLTLEQVRRDFAGRAVCRVEYVDGKVVSVILLPEKE